jgi:hypothetical protein
MLLDFLTGALEQMPGSQTKIVAAMIEAALS